MALFAFASDALDGSNVHKSNYAGKNEAYVSDAKIYNYLHVRNAF